MNILAVVGMYAPMGGGAERALHELLRHAIRRGHTAHVRHVRPGSPYKYGGVYVDTPGPAPDVVVSQIDGIALALRVLHGKPLVVWAHAPGQHLWAGGLASVVLANSMDTMRAARTGARSVVLCRPHVPVRDWQTLPADPVWDATLVNMMVAKGARDFYRAARLLPDMRFLAVRGGWGAQEPPVDAPNVTVHPYTAHPVRDVYAHTRVLVMPSHVESWGRCAVEAACSGIPTIAYPTPGLLESMGDAGVWARTPQGIADALRCLQDDDAYACHAADARRMAEHLERETLVDMDAAIDAMEAVA